MVDMNKFGSWTQSYRCYERPKAMDNVSYFGSRPTGYGYYEQLRVVDHMNG